MTVQGGKLRQERNLSVPPSPFAALTPLVEGQDTGLEDSFRAVAEAFSDYPGSVRMSVRLINQGARDSWELQCGGATSAARHAEPETADVYLVVREDTWMQIVQGRVAPFDALFERKLRVGGNTDLAKDIVRHLSDPSVPFVPPC